MTQWNGIKVGGLLKQTGQGSRGAPPALVVKMEYDDTDEDEGIDTDNIWLTLLKEGELHLVELQWEPGRWSQSPYTFNHPRIRQKQPWPYKAVA
jgi:hypothetical protein